MVPPRVTYGYAHFALRGASLNPHGRCGPRTAPIALAVADSVVDAVYSMTGACLRMGERVDCFAPPTTWMRAASTRMGR